MQALPILSQCENFRGCKSLKLIQPGCLFWISCLYAASNAIEYHHASGFLVIDALGHVVQVVLNQATSLASVLVGSLRRY